MLPRSPNQNQCSIILGSVNTHKLNIQNSYRVGETLTRVSDLAEVILQGQWQSQKWNPRVLIPCSVSSPLPHTLSHLNIIFLLPLGCILSHSRTLMQWCLALL